MAKLTIAQEMQEELAKDGRRPRMSELQNSLFHDMCMATNIMQRADNFADWDHAAHIWWCCTLLYMSALTGEF